jgi:hypothetical protein
VKLAIQKKHWPLREPFVISRATYTTSDVITVELRDGDFLGRGEAAGVDYHGETQDSMLAQVESVRGRIKLDKTGELTAALELAHAARSAGLRPARVRGCEASAPRRVAELFVRPPLYRCGRCAARCSV